LAVIVASIIDDKNPREIMTRAIGEPSEYIELLKRAYLDCVDRLD
jgi:hypothetical protein